MRERAIVETNTEYRVKLRFIILTFFLVLFYTSLLFSATIYIDPTNTSSNQNGTITNPYNSWHSVTFTNGNIYLQKRGTTFTTTGGITLTNRSNIVLGAYGTGAKPIFLSSSATARIIRLTNSSNCTVRDLAITSSTGVLGPIAIGLDGTSANNLIDSCKLYNCEYGVNMNVAVGTTGNRILNTIIHTMGDDGMYLKDMKDIEIGNCHIYNINRKYLINPDQSYSAGDCIQLVGNPNATNALVVNIHHNILDHSSTGNKFCLIIVGDYYSGTVAGNTMIGSSSTSCIYLWHTTGTMVIKNNILQDGAYSIYSYVHDLQVQYNKIFNNSLGIFILPSTLTQTTLTALNNVFYDINGACISMSNSSSTLVSKNNAFFLTSSSAKAYSTNTSPVTSNYNNFNVQQSGFINNYGTLASWRSATGNDLNSFVANPLFVNPTAGNFCIQSTSPCLNTGSGVNLQTDFFGTQVPQGNNPDIGYHEYITNQGGTNLAPVINNQSFQLNENSANATSVGTVIASDPNAGQLLTYSITGGNTNNAFAINPSTGLISVANSQALNFELITSFPLIVRVTDNGTGNLWSQATVTIGLLNVNEVPVIANQSFSVVQNATNGTIVGTVAASDPDQGQTLSFSITAGNTNNAFAINTTTGRITVANSTAVVQGTFSLTTRATDNGSPVLWSAATITITVTPPANQAPVISNQTFSILQYLPNGSAVGTVAASDPNAGQVLTYLITAGNTNGAFTINTSNGNLTVSNSAALSPQAFSLTVRVTDNGTPVLYSQATVTVNVTLPPNQAPVIVNQSFSVTQNAPNGTFTGTVVATDPNAGQVLTYSITGGNTNNAFAINASTGNLTVANTTALSPGVFSLTVRVTDNGTPVLYSQATVTVNVTLPPNQAPVIANQSFSVTQNAPNGTFTGTVVATDPNAGQVLTYSITGGNTNNAFAINASTGNLTVANTTALSPGVFSLTVRVTDNGSPNLFSQATITINVNPAPNQAPVISNQSFSIVQYSPNGTSLGIVIASDPNSGQSLTYSITGGNTNNAFAINASTGNLIVNNSTILSPQFFYLIVRVTDNGSPVLYSQATVAINVTTPPNQAPVISNQSFSTPVNSPTGTLLGMVSASDPNGGQTLTYAITAGNPNSAFAINISNGNLIIHNSSFLIVQTYYLTVRVTDNGSPSLWSQATITVIVTAPSNNAPQITNQTFNIVQYSPTGSIVGTVVASDPDSGQLLTYSITGGNANNAFSINTTTGILTVVNSSALAPQTFPLVVRVTDNGIPVLFTQATISIIVTSPPNQAPVISNQTFAIDENRPSGTQVGTVIASDPNQGQTILYSITSGNTNNAFTLNPGNGLLTVNNTVALNFESTQSFSLIVRATDNGTGNLWSQATVTVNINNVNEAPVLNQSTLSIAQFASNGSFVGIVSGSDPDAGQSVSYQIISGNTSNAFNLNANNGALNVANSSALNITVNPVFYLTVRIQDNGQPSLYSTGIITVNVIANKQGDEITDGNFQDDPNQLEFSIYPNPSSSGIFNIKSNVTNGTVADIQVFNTSGKLIEMQNTSGDSNIELDLSAQADGVYILKIKSMGGIYSYKAIKN